MPLAVRGSSSTTLISVGSLHGDSLLARSSRSAGTFKQTPSTGTTSAATSEPNLAFGRPKTRASRTSGCARSTASIGSGWTVRPLTMIADLIRLRTWSPPSRPSVPRSPVLNERWARRVDGSVAPVAEQHVLTGDDDLASAGVVGVGGVDRDRDVPERRADLAADVRSRRRARHEADLGEAVALEDLDAEPIAPPSGRLGTKSITRGQDVRHRRERVARRRPA